jgi:small subunit ribosomal protein S19
MLIKKKIELPTSSKKSTQFEFANRKFIKRILNKTDIVDDVNILTKLRYKLGKGFILLPLVNRLYLKHLVNVKKLDKPKVKEIQLFIRNRSSIIYPALIDLSLFVYNGKKFMPLTVLKTFVGHKFGEFVLTRNFKGHKKKNKPTGIKKKIKITKYTQFFENCLYLPNILKQKMNFFKEYINKKKTIKKVLKFDPHYPYTYVSKWRKYNKIFFIDSFKKLVPLEKRVRSMLNKKYKIYTRKKVEFYKNFKTKYKLRNWLRMNWFRMHFKKFSLHLKKKRPDMIQNTFYKKYIFKKPHAFINKFNKF